MAGLHPAPANAPLVAILGRRDPAPCLEEVKTLVESDAHFIRRFQYIQMDDIFACTPLELAVNNPKVNVDVIDYIIEKWPKSVQEKNYLNRDLPLHVACQRGCSVDVLKTLVKHYPEALTQEGSAGTLPLHKLMWSDKVSLEAIQFLLGEHPNAIQQPGRLGFLPLHYALQRATVSLEVVQCLVEAYPESLSFRPKMQSGRNRDEEGALPIHFACAYNISLDIIRYLVDKCPDSLKKMNKRGKIPLEIAFTGRRNSTTTELLDFLMEMTPSYLVNPRELLLANMNVCVNVQIIHYLLANFPDLAAIQTPLRGELPLHICCRHMTNEQDEKEMLESIMDIYPTALFTVSKYGRSPLEEMKRNPSCCTDIRTMVGRRMREMLASVFNNTLSVDACDHVLAFLM